MDAVADRQGSTMADPSDGADTTIVRAVERFRAYLRGQSLRATVVRDAIVRAVMTRDGHFRVDDIVRDLRAAGVRASLVSVYRTVPLLLGAGIIRPTVLSGELRLYEAAFEREHHDHLICSRCGKVVEFQFEAFEILQRDVAAKHGFDLTLHFHELVGICADCKTRGAEAN